jgi:hypothetical protein
VRALESGCIYFVEAIGLDLIKIGYTANIVKRLATIQTYCPAPISIVLVMPGDIVEEKRLHTRCFRMFNVSGEWYRKNDRIMNAAHDWRYVMTPIAGTCCWLDEPGKFWKAFESEHRRHPALSKIDIADVSDFSREKLEAKRSRAKWLSGMDN